MIHDGNLVSENWGLLGSQIGRIFITIIPHRIQPTIQFPSIQFGVFLREGIRQIFFQNELQHCLCISSNSHNLKKTAFLQILCKELR
jgi:hypothetical protein